jgi:TonB-linked SusC/RagA family outer membrane protein
MFLPVTGKLPFRKGRYLSKTLLIMKFIAIFMFAAGLQVSATDYAQNITLAQNNVSLKKVFKEIERQSGYSFFYKDRLLTQTEKVDVNVKGASVKAVLDQCLKNTSLSYTILDKIIVIKAKNLVTPVVSVGETAAPAPENIIAGTVKDAQGNPLPGVSVIIKGSTKGTSTNADGKFTIDANVGDILEFSIVGYGKKSATVGSAHEINIRLDVEAVAGNEIVVVGYGTQKKSDLTGSVASVQSKDFVKGVATDALQLLSGKAAGVDVSQANAEPGGSLNIRIRGVGSINSSNSALIVIDGVPAGSTSNINPNDIQSIEVLKDASAAAIYGTRAANGVVLITTKKGQQGPAQVTYSTYWAHQTPASKLSLLNATQYMHYLNDISKDGGATNLPFTDAQIAAAGNGTDWQDQLFRNAWTTNQQVSISGANKQVKYYTSLRYLDQKGIMVSSGIKQYNLLMNLEVTPNDKFKFGINLNGNLNLKDEIADQSNSGNENADPLNAASQFDPTLSPNKDANGKYATNPSIALDNPVAIAYGYDYKQQNNRIYGNTYGEYRITKDLKATLKLGGDLYNIRDDNYTDQTTQRGLANGGIGDIYSTNQSYWLSEGLVNYDKEFGQHHISLLGGATWEKFLALTQESYATGFLSDVTGTNLLQSGNAASAVVSSSKTAHTLQSYFGRANYTLKDRYLFTATIRRDGTSRFSETNKYAIFPSVAVGWRISEEPFMKNISAINNLKLRVSYGKTGNEGIGNFATIPTYIAGGNTVLGGQIVNGAQPARLPNPDLRWETTGEYNFGLDFGFANNRISGSVEYYIKNTYDQLFNKPVPTTTGFSTILTNFGNVRNAGVDFSLNSQNIIGKFQWTTNLTFSTLNNKVTELPPFIGQIVSGGVIANIPGFSLVEQGAPMYAFYGYKVTGVFQAGDDIAHSAQPTAKPGWPKFLDTNGDGKIDASDRVILGNPYPDFTYSFGNSFTYKNFGLNIYFLGVQGIKTFNGNIVESMFPINFNRNIISKYYLDRWTPENPNTGYPSGVNSAVYFGNGKMINSYSIQDASYLRLKNVTLSYNVPLNNSKVFKSVQFLLTGENLLTVTRFVGYDPAANQTGDGSNVAKSSYNNYPLAKVYSIGANVTF